MKTQAQWEIWLQVEIAIHLKSITELTIREQQYDNSQMSLDILATINETAFAIELKTESLRTGRVSGMTMENALLADKKKLLTQSITQKAVSLNCKQLSTIVFGIGDISKYESTASKMLKSNSNNFSSVKVDGQFGVYAMLVKECGLSE